MEAARLPLTAVRRDASADTGLGAALTSKLEGAARARELEEELEEEEIARGKGAAVRVTLEAADAPALRERRGRRAMLDLAAMV